MVFLPQSRERRARDATCLGGWTKTPYRRTFFAYSYTLSSHSILLRRKVHYESGANLGFLKFDFNILVLGIIQ